MKTTLFAACLIGLLCLIGCMSPAKLQVRKQHNHYIIGDYQLIYHFDTLWVRDKGRTVGVHVDKAGGVQHGAFLDSLVLADNL